MFKIWGKGILYIEYDARGFCLRGILSRGILSLGGSCPEGFCPRTFRTIAGTGDLLSNHPLGIF